MRQSDGPARAAGAPSVHPERLLQRRQLSSAHPGEQSTLLPSRCSRQLSNSSSSGRQSAAERQQWATKCPPERSPQGAVHLAAQPAGRGITDQLLLGSQRLQQKMG